MGVGFLRVLVGMFSGSFFALRHEVSSPDPNVWGMPGTVTRYPANWRFTMYLEGAQECRHNSVVITTTRVRTYGTTLSASVPRLLSYRCKIRRRHVPGREGRRGSCLSIR